MLRSRSYALSLLMLAGDLLAVTAAFLVSLLIRETRFEQPQGGFPYAEHLRLLVVALPIFALVFSYFRLYDYSRLRSLPEELDRLLRGLLWAFFSLMLLVFWLKYQFTSRIF